MRLKHWLLVAFGALTTVLPAGSALSEDKKFRWNGDGPGIVNHPVGIVPSEAIRIPNGWPLSASGALTCNTCHTNAFAGALRALPRQAETDDDLGKSRTFCAVCHAANDSRPGASRHWLAVPRAHVREDDDESTGGERLDAESRECLACHDGIGAPEVSYQLSASGAGMASSFGDRGRNHPIGRPYREGVSKKSDIPFVHRSRLPKAVRLPGGTVGCVSCHNLYEPGKSHLSVPIERSELCFACHDGK